MYDDPRDSRLTGFPPAGATGPMAAPRFLVLGSFPSAESLRRGEYYGHPRNGFWSVLAWCAGLEEAPFPYPDRLALLEKAGVVLWDVFAGCRRRGSADSAISAAEPNPVLELLARFPSIKSIGLNGSAAAAGFARYIKGSLAADEGAAGRGRGASAPVVPRIGEKAEWDMPLPAGRRIQVRRLPSTSPIPTAGFRTARDKLPVWKAFFTIHP